MDVVRNELILKKEEEGERRGPILFIYFAPISHSLKACVLLAALKFYMKNRALSKCPDAIKAYADCVNGRTISIVFACRGAANALNDCLGCLTLLLFFTKFIRIYIVF